MMGLKALIEWATEENIRQNKEGLKKIKCPYYDECWSKPIQDQPIVGMAKLCASDTQENLENCGWFKYYRKRDGEKDV